MNAVLPDNFAKSKVINEYIRENPSDFQSKSPKDIVRDIKKKTGITISEATIYNRRKALPAPTTSIILANGGSNGDSSVLLAVKELCDKHGGIDSIDSAVQLLRKLQL